MCVTFRYQQQAQPLTAFHCHLHAPHPHSRTQDLIEHLGFENMKDFRDPDIGLAFVWSRMRVLDALPMKSMIKLVQVHMQQ